MHLLTIIRVLFVIAAVIFVTSSAVATSSVSEANTESIQLLHNIHGAHILSAKTGEAPLQTFTALAFRNGKVVQVGDEQALSKQYPQAQRLNGQGRFVLPGLIDAHTHMAGLGFLQSEVDLRGLDFSNTLQTIQHFSRKQKNKTWLSGRGWNQVIWPGKAWPDAADLDALDIDRPVWLRRVDGHAGWANRAALRAAGIDKKTQAPVGGEILRHADGQPSGIFIDNAMTLIERVIPAPSQQDIEQALGVAFALSLKNGLVSVHDAGIDLKTYRAYIALAQRNALPMWVYPMISASDNAFEKMLAKGFVGSADSRLFVRSIKISADGALGSRGAAMMQPYSDGPQQQGLMLHSDRALDYFYSNALKQGFQINVHAIGDQANRKVLDKFAKFTDTKPQQSTGLRHRIEHAQVVALEDMPRFISLNLIASMQPIHAVSDMNMAEDRIGKARLKGAYAWRTFLDQGTPIAAGSDFPVESVNPFYGLHAAVTRQNSKKEPKGGWMPEQKLTLAEALKAFTLDAAFAAHQEQVLGNLEAGKSADFIVVDRDIFTIDPSEIWQTEVLQTWVAGEPVYTATQH